MSTGLPTSDTIVTYPEGATTSTGTVVYVGTLPDGRRAVLLDVTACHPVDAAWPDQPSDRGHLVIDGTVVPIVDSVVGATDGEALYLGIDIPVRKGTDGWAFVVVHLVEETVTDGASAEVIVDVDYRRALSAGHTACHLASLALNAQLVDAWSKEVATDGLGHPNFDSEAIETSTIGEYGSTDVYRIGKSLRKKGFTPAALTERLDEVAAGANTLLAAWVESGAAVTIVREGDALTHRREWRCELPGHPVSIPCGGTHITSLAQLASVRVALEVEDLGSAIELRMTTSARPRPPASGR